jgi:hypothetical protein
LRTKVIGRLRTERDPVKKEQLALLAIQLKSDVPPEFLRRQIDLMAG